LLLADGIPLGRERSVGVIPVIYGSVLRIGRTRQVRAGVVERPRLRDGVAAGHFARHAHAEQVIQRIVSIGGVSQPAGVGLRSIGFQNLRQISKRVHREGLRMIGGISHRNSVAAWTTVA
jgi:hypothetical protein